jgi:biopolymer transport protein ExbB
MYRMMNLKTVGAICALVLMIALHGAALAQTPAGTAKPIAATEGTKEEKTEKHGENKTLFEKLKEGGWVMIPLALCSMGTIYLIVDGLLRTAVTRNAPAPEVETVQNHFRSGDYVAAYAFCKGSSSAFANTCRSALASLGEGKTAVDEAVVGALGKENAKIQYFISYLSVMGVCTPMIGLLGTVTGMVTAFETLGSSGIGDPSKLSAAIGEVLIATASGLFIAIPAFMAYYILRNRAANAIHHVQEEIASLYRKMPYEQLTGVNVGDEEIFANTPNWISGADGH